MVDEIDKIGKHHLAVGVFFFFFKRKYIISFDYDILMFIFCRRKKKDCGAHYSLRFSKFVKTKTRSEWRRETMTKTRKTKKNGFKWRKPFSRCSLYSKLMVPQHIFQFDDWGWFTCTKFGWQWWSENRSTSPATILPNAGNQMKIFSRLPNIVAIQFISSRSARQSNSSSSSSSKRENSMHVIYVLAKWIFGKMKMWRRKQQYQMSGEYF